jgi:hypothetical protein
MSPLAGTHLDPLLVVHLDDEYLEAPIFDRLFKETVQGGSFVALDLQEYLNNMDAKRHEAPEDTQAFTSLDPEYGEVCPHSVPIEATCSWCIEGIMSTAQEPIQGTVIIGTEPTVGRIYGKPRDGQPWWRKLRQVFGR